MLLMCMYVCVYVRVSLPTVSSTSSSLTVCEDNLPVSLLYKLRCSISNEVYFVVEDHNLVLHLQMVQAGVHLLLGEGRVLLDQTIGERTQTSHLHHAIEYPTGVNHDRRVYVGDTILYYTYIYIYYSTRTKPGTRTLCLLRVCYPEREGYPSVLPDSVGRVSRS